LDLEFLVASLVGTAVLTGSLLFLPAILEIIHPRDAGPRIIAEVGSLGLVPMLSLEEEHALVGGSNVDVFGCLRGLYNLDV
jgi:hypothetical protein